MSFVTEMPESMFWALVISVMLLIHWVREAFKHSRFNRK